MKKIASHEDIDIWNDPLMHVEVRRPGDYLRASNNLRLTPGIRWSRLSSCRTIELECRVEEINKRYSLLRTNYDTCGDVRGFAVDGGFLDGYITQDTECGFSGIIKPQGYFHPGISILEITAGGSEVKCSGIAFCLSLNEPMIKVIPEKYGDRLLSPGDRVRIRLGV